VQKRVEIEAEYRTGIDRLIEQFKGSKNRAMLTQAYHEHQKWEEQNQLLLEERKKYAIYVGLFEDMTPESFLGLRKGFPLFFSLFTLVPSPHSPLCSLPVEYQS